METPAVATPASTGAQPPAPSGAPKAAAPKTPIVEVKPTPGKPAAKAETPKVEAPPQKHKVKVDGVEQEVTLDDLLRDYQHRASSSKRFEEASKLKAEALTEKKWVGEFLSSASDPDKLEQLLADPRVKVDVKKFAQRVLAKQIQEQMRAEEEKNLPPEQRELRELKRQLEELKNKDAKAAEEQKTKAREAAVAKHRDTLGAQVLECLKAASHLPQDPETAKLVVSEIRKNLEQGRPFDVADIVERLDAAEGARIAKRYKALGPAKLAKQIDPELRKALRELDLEDLKKADPIGQARSGPETGPQVRQAEAPRKWRSEAEVRAGITGDQPHVTKFVPREQGKVGNRDELGRYKR